LESLLSSIKTTAGHHREAIIQGIDLEDHLSMTSIRTYHPMVSFDDGEHIVPDNCWSNPEEGSSIFHGPGSAYSTGLIRPYPSARTSSDVCASKSISSLPGIVINECVELFFQWQRPFSTIVDREALRSNCPSGLTGETSLGLLYAVCALGSLMSHDHNIKDLAPSFASAAENLLRDSFFPSHLSTVQAFLLCAVFESGRGNVSKAWMYSGVALRMAEDLGVHEDHLPPVSTGSSGTPSVDFESRRRMSLTLSISDKLPPFLVQWQTSLTQVLESSVSLSEGHP
jgi:hypothetical protein